MAGTAAAAAYLDAKYHITSDLSQGGIDNAAARAQKFIGERMAQDRLLLYHDLQEWAKKDLPGHTFLEYESRAWTYREFYLDLQKVGNWLMNDLGIQKHEMVALSGPSTLR